MEDQEPPKKKGRGEAKLLFLNTLQKGQKFQLELDEDTKQPTGAFSANLSAYIGYLARDGNKFPLTFSDWRDLIKAHPERTETAINEIKDIFELPCDLEEWVVLKLNELWKGHKRRMKLEGFEPYNSEEERLAHRPSQVVPSQWPILIKYWTTQKHVDASKRNKENKSKQTLHHRAGSKPFVSCKKELEVRLKRLPTRVDIFKETYGSTTKPVDEEVTKRIRRMEELRVDSVEGDESDDESDFGRDDIFAKVMGEDRGGRVRCYGNTAKPKKIWGPRGESSRSAGRKKDQEIKLLQETVAKLLETTQAQGVMLKKLQDELLQKSGGNDTQDPEGTQSPSSQGR